MCATVLQAAIQRPILTDLLHARWLVTGGTNQSGDPRGYGPLVAGRGLMPRPRRGGREPRRSEATVGRGKAKLFPLRVDFDLYWGLCLILHDRDDWTGRG
jgi:hypothetical protein